jgi:hypothetical protein
MTTQTLDYENLLIRLNESIYQDYIITKLSKPFDWLKAHSIFALQSRKKFHGSKEYILQQEHSLDNTFHIWEMKKKLLEHMWRAKLYI